ncbi:hypothetical protein AAMO2058_000989100 [Amorphochlora amoebiformis]
MVALGVAGYALGLAAIMWLWAPANINIPMHPEFEARAPGEFAVIGGIKTHFILRGNGPRLVVLIHGLGKGISEAYNPVILPELAKKHTVLAIDYFGRGFTEGTTANCDMRQLVAHIAQVLLYLSERTNGLTVKPFTLVGYSMGGALVTGFALQFPHLIRKLILIAPAGTAIPIPLEGKLVKLPIIGDLLFQLLGNLILPMQMPKGHYDWDSVDPVLKEELKQAILDQIKYHPGYIHNFLSSLRHFPLNDMEKDFAQLEHLPFPVMAIWGDSDRVCPYAESSARIKQLIPKLELYTIKNSGHDDVSEKDALEVAKVIAEFEARGLDPDSSDLPIEDVDELDESDDQTMLAE